MTFYHGTSKEIWEEIQKEGVLFGRRYVTDSSGNIIKEVDRCTYLAVDKEEAECYGGVLLEVEYEPLDKKGNIKKIKRKSKSVPANNYCPDSWQLRVYEPIPLEQVKLLHL